MTSSERYRYLKEHGLCVQCGKSKDNGGVLCKACRRKKSEYEKSYRKMMKELSICTSCKKVKVPGDETICPECRAKDSNNHARYREKHREKIRKRNNYLRNKQKDEFRENGVCVWCGKRNATPGYKSCSICRAKRRDAQRNKYVKIHPINREEWPRYGWCYRCGDPVMEGMQLCEKCYEQNVENSRLAATSREKHWWRNANKELFRKKENNYAKL